MALASRVYRNRASAKDAQLRTPLQQRHQVDNNNMFFSRRFSLLTYCCMKACCCCCRHCCCCSKLHAHDKITVDGKLIARAHREILPNEDYSDPYVCVCYTNYYWEREYPVRLAPKTKPYVFLPLLIQIVRNSVSSIAYIHIY